MFPHAFEIQVLRVARDNEVMGTVCQNCGKRRGYEFRVWTAPKPDWYRKFAKQFNWF